MKLDYACCGDGIGGGAGGANAMHEGPCRVCCEGSEKVVVVLAVLVVLAKVIGLEEVVVVVTVKLHPATSY